MLIVLPKIGVFGEIENKRTNNKNRNNKNQLHNRSDTHLTISLCCAIGDYKNIENESQYGDC